MVVLADSSLIARVFEQTTEHSMLLRNLKARHLNMIALGGSIGTGIFLASGYAISVAGPGGAIAAYSLIAIMVYFLITSLGEMATHKPTTGSFL